jgi:transcriptional regulator with XRE-family HTH domain
MKERIEEILRDKKLTQAEFADKIGVNRSSITHLMTGRNKSSDTVVARTLLTFQDINPQWLSEGIGEKYKSFAYNPPVEKTTLHDEDNEWGDENLFTHFSPPIVEEKQAPLRNPQILFPEEPYNKLPNIETEKPIHQQNIEKEKELPNTNQKQIRKIVFFYDDKTFEEYYPENT